MADVWNSIGQQVFSECCQELAFLCYWYTPVSGFCIKFAKDLRSLEFVFFSSRVGILCGYLLMALFRCLGSRHIRILPSFFVLYTMLEHQSVCSLTRLMTPVFSICLSSSLIWGRRFIWHFLGLSMCGIASGCTWIYAGSLNCPMRSNCSGYFFFRSLIGLVASIWWTSTRWEVIAMSPALTGREAKNYRSWYVDYVQLCIIPCASLVFAMFMVLMHFTLSPEYEVSFASVARWTMSLMFCFGYICRNVRSGRALALAPVSILTCNLYWPGFCW